MFLGNVSAKSIELCKCCILDDDVTGSRYDPQALALDHPARAFSEKSLVRGNGDTQSTGIIAATS